MQNKSRSLRIYVIIGILLTGALVSYFAGHAFEAPPAKTAASGPPKVSPSQAADLKQTTRLPPPGEPLIASSKILVAESAAGSSLAATRLFNDSRECLEVKRLQPMVQTLQKNRALILDPGSPIGKSMASDLQRQAAIAQIDANIKKASSGDALCQGSDALLENGHIYAIAMRAAELGNNAAAACLLSAPYDSGTISDQQGKQYRSEAYRLAEEAVSRGSWQAAMALSLAYNGQLKGTGYASYTEEINPEKEYQYTRLIRLGVPDGSPEAVMLDKQLSAMTSALNPDQEFRADTWADQMYKNSFFYSGVPSPSVSPCEY